MNELATKNTVLPVEVISTLKGFDELRVQVAQHVDAQKCLYVKLTSHGLETGRLIMEFAARKEVRGEVDRLNKATKDAGKGGRPIAYHCHVAKLLSESGIGTSKEWLEKCARAHERAKALGYKVRDVNLLSIKQTETETVTKLPLPAGNATLHTPVLKDDSHFPAPIEDTLPAPDRVFPAPPEPKAPEPKHTFKEFLAAFVAKMEHIKTNAGEIGLKRKGNQEAWADAVAQWWKDIGVDVEITFEN